jgi:hypothetical protein
MDQRAKAMDVLTRVNRMPADAAERLVGLMEPREMAAIAALHADLPGRLDQCARLTEVHDQLNQILTSMDDRRRQDLANPET